MDNQKQIIKEVIENILKKLCVDFNEVRFVDESGFGKGAKFLIKTNNSGLLIGTEGATVLALNHLIKKIIWQKLNNENNNERISFFIDVNDYQSKNIEKIKTQAMSLAERADLFKRDIEMEAMSSYERMIVHSVLADNPKVRTESAGEGEFRRVIIKIK